jgi:hypothetical protein
MRGIQLETLHHGGISPDQSLCWGLLAWTIQGASGGVFRCLWGSKERTNRKESEAKTPHIGILLINIREMQISSG